MQHLHYDWDLTQSPLQIVLQQSPVLWNLRVCYRATGHIYLMERLHYRPCRLPTPQCHQLRRVRAVTLRVVRAPDWRDQPEPVVRVYLPPRPVLCAFLPLRGTSFHTVETAKTFNTALRVTTFAAFAGDCNRIIHALNGNYTRYSSFCPKSHSKAWRESFFLPNGMRVFSFACVPQRYCL